MILSAYKYMMFPKRQKYTGDCALQPPAFLYSIIAGITDLSTKIHIRLIKNHMLSGANVFSHTESQPVTAAFISCTSHCVS